MKHRHQLIILKSLAQESQINSISPIQLDFSVYKSARLIRDLRDAAAGRDCSFICKNNTHHICDDDMATATKRIYHNQNVCSL